MPAGTEPGQPTSPKNVGANFFRSGADRQIDIGWMQQLAYVDLSKEVAVLGSSTERRAFKREATPLIDLLPQVWEKYLSGNHNIAPPAPSRPR